MFFALINQQKKRGDDAVLIPLTTESDEKSKSELESTVRNMASKRRRKEKYERKVFA